MFRHYLLFYMIVLLVPGIYAQEDDNNITIQSAKETYRFVAGNKENPVMVKQMSVVSYVCNKFRADIPIVDFYNNQVQMNSIVAKVNGVKLKNLNTDCGFYEKDGIFYSDARVCYFKLPFEKKGARGEVSIEKTTLDPRYFTSIYFTEPYYIENKEVQIIVPSWMKIELKEYNFKGYTISKSMSTDGDVNIYSYKISGANAFRSEQRSPGMSYLAPHLLVMTKEASPAGERITYFNTLADQYAWYHELVKQIGNDPEQLKKKVLEITKNAKDDLEKVKAVYLWVQDNVRYIAYEDGIAGFKPENAQNVLAKKYGDCKGMANLLSEMLKILNLDGRLCWLGTDHIAYDYSTPSLGVDNHMICAWMYKGNVYYLDATEKYIGFNEIAQRIQGRQVLIEDGEKYLLKNIPVASATQNVNVEKRKLSIDGNDLKGKVVQTWKGESKEWLLTNLHEIKRDNQEEALKKFLADGNSNYQITNLKVYNLHDYNADLKIEYDLVYKDAVVTVGKELYLDIDNRKDFSQSNIDTLHRKFPYLFNFKTHIVFETEIELPGNVKAGSVPTSIKIDHPSYGM